MKNFLDSPLSRMFKPNDGVSIHLLRNRPFLTKVYTLNKCVSNLNVNDQFYSYKEHIDILTNIYYETLNNVKHNEIKVKSGDVCMTAIQQYKNINQGFLKHNVGTAPGFKRIH